MLTQSSVLYFENKLQLDRHAEGQARDAEDDPSRKLIRSKNLFQQFGRTIRDFRVLPEIAFGGDEHTELGDRGYLVERAQEGFRCRERVQGGGRGGLRPSSIVNSPPTRPMNWGLRSTTGSIPLRKSRLPLTAST